MIIIPINATLHVSLHIAHSGDFGKPKQSKPFVVSTAWLQIGNFFNSNRSSLLIPMHREDYIICITQRAMERPQSFFFFLHSHSKALAGLPQWVQPILQHTAMPVSPSTKPSANLLPNSFFYPTITPQALWSPGTGPSSGTVLNVRHRC